MATVALLIRTANEEAMDLAADTAAWLESEGHRARVLRITPQDVVIEDGLSSPLADADLSGSDLAVSLGGDGTFLRVAQLAWAAGIPVMGVNFGRVGYLNEIAPMNLHRALTRALADELVVEERAVVAVDINGELVASPERDRSGSEPSRTAEDPRQRTAFNEVVVEKTLPGHTVHLATSIDGELFLEYSADGVIVATPTGSTAYNLSAGGPALSPRLKAMVVTPIAPHLSIDRSLVLDAAQVVTVYVASGRPAVLVVDGRDTGRLQPGAEVWCRLSDKPLRVISVGERGFAGDLRDALAIDPRR